MQRVACSVLVACVILVAPVAGVAGEVRRVEAVGAVALEGAAVPVPIPRDAAMQVGLSEAVRQVTASHQVSASSGICFVNRATVFPDEPAHSRMRAI